MPLAVYDPHSVAIDSALTRVDNPRGLSFVRVDVDALGALLRAAVRITTTPLEGTTLSTVRLLGSLVFHIEDAELFALLDSAGGRRADCLTGGWRRNGQLSSYADKYAKVSYQGITSAPKRLAKAKSILDLLDTVEARAEVCAVAVAAAVLSVTRAAELLTSEVRGTALRRYAAPNNYTFTGEDAEALAPTLLAEREARARVEKAEADWRTVKAATFAQKRELLLAHVKAHDHGVLPDGVFEAICAGLAKATPEIGYWLR